MIFQGSTPELKVIVSGYFPWDEIEQIELAVASEGKDNCFLLSKDEVTYSEEQVEPEEGEPYAIKALYFTLSQEQTFALKGGVAVQLRYLVLPRTVYVSNIATLAIHGSISKLILGEKAGPIIGNVSRLVGVTFDAAPTPVSIVIQEARGGGGAPFNDMLELTPNNPISDSIEVDVKKRQHLFEWIRDILVTKKAPTITLSQYSVTYTQGEALAKNALVVACTIVEGTGSVNAVTVDGAALSPTALAFNVTYPSSSISAGVVQSDRSIVVTAAADDGKAAEAKLAIKWVYKAAYWVEGDAAKKEITYGNATTIKVSNQKWFYVSVPASKGAPKVTANKLDYTADSTASETRHNLTYTIYGFKHKVDAEGVYTVIYA